MLLKREPFGFYKPVDYPCTIQNYLLWYPVWSTSEEISHCFHFLQCLENHKCDSDDPHKAFLSLNITLLKKKISSKYFSVDFKHKTCYGTVYSTRAYFPTLVGSWLMWIHKSKGKNHLQLSLLWVVTICNCTLMGTKESYSSQLNNLLTFFPMSRHHHPLFMLIDKNLTLIRGSDFPKLVN